MEVITPWPHMPNLIQLVQGTEHGSVSDLIAFCPYVEEQLLQIKFDWPVRPATKSSSFDWPIRLANGYRDPHLLPTAMIRYMVVVLARPIFCGVLARPILADIESGTRENEVITPWSQMPYLIQLVQGTEQALPLYDPVDPVHGSVPGEIVFLAVLPTAMIRYMVVVLAR